MELLYFALFSFSLLVPGSSEGIDDFIFDVDPQCGDSMAENNPVVTVRTDFDISVVAVCANGEKSFVTVDGVDHILQGTFFEKGSLCLYTKRGNTNVYTIQVNIALGNSVVQQKSMKCIVTCTFDLNGMKTSEEHVLTRGIFAPIEVREDKGQAVEANLALDVYDVDDNIITTMRRGRLVYLSASTDGENSELGLRPVSCFAEAVESKERFQFIRAGCGDGLILEQNEGFNTTGLSTRSPYFRSFQINDEAYLTFECVFSLCASACDGNSCGKGRDKRRSGLFQLVAKSRPIIYE